MHAVLDDCARPVIGYVTQMQHADARRYRWRDLLTLAGLGSSARKHSRRRTAPP
jgi:hypothetical protein